MSKIEVNTVAPQCGTTLTLGENDDTVVLGTGAAFGGGVGAVKWETTPQTGSFGAVAGRGYFMNTTSGPLTLTLPATPSAGDIVSVKDYAQTFNTNNCTLARNGSNIEGTASDAVLDGAAESVTFVYVDSTKGWVLVGESSTNYGPAFITATGGTILTCGDFKTHIFTGPGTFCVSAVGNPAGSDSVDYFVVAGGGSGASGHNNNSTGTGGGGAGGFRVSNSVGCVPSPTMSPLSNPTGLPVAVQGYPISVGGGGTGGNNPAPNRGTSGANSIFSTITSAGGGAGGSGFNTPLCHQCGASGGSGGGAGGSCNPGKPTGGGGAGNTPLVTPAQGNNGGDRVSCNAASGGGAGAVGGDANSPGTSPGAAIAGAGGIGSFVADAFIKPGCAPSYGTPGPVSSTRYFAGGGGAGASAYTGTTGATGGAGGGANGGNYPAGAGSAGTTNTGGAGGGGGTNSGSVGGNGGSGIVMIRYKFQ